MPSDTRHRRVPLLVWVLVGLHAALLLSSAMLYPALYGYDEPQHVDLAYSYSQGHGPYDPGERWLANGVRNAERGPGYPPSRPFSDTPLPDRDDRRSFDGQGGDQPYKAGLPNQMVQHPPLPYLLGGAVLSVPGVSGLAYDQQIWLLRLLSVLMVAPLPLLAWAAARALLGDGPPALVAAALPLAIPGLTRIGAAYGNDAAMALVGGLLVWLLARVLGGDLRARTGAAVGAVLLAGLLTKGFALVLPPIAVLAYVVAGVRARVLPVAPLAWVAGLSAAGGLWWLRNVVLYGAVQPTGVGPAYADRLAGPPNCCGPLSDFVPGFAERISNRFWGGIGLPEGPQLSPRLTLLWTAVLLAAVALALVLGRGRRGPLAVVLLPALLTGLLVAAGSFSTFHTHNGVYGGVHGRYLYVAVVGLAVLFAAGLAAVARDRAGRWLPLAVLVAALGTQLLATRTLVGAWWVPAARNGGDEWGELTGALDGIGRWSPLPAALTYAPFLLALALAVVALVVAVPRRTAAPAAAEPEPELSPTAPG